MKNLPTCTGWSANRTCLQRLADGWIGYEDLCPRCTGLFVAALDKASPEPLTWHPNFAKRAGGESR